ncbi:hypothetical protein PIL02S_05460 [Paenibacillus illinoisensis]|uniref:Uncharacterized protein n=1 Tax=Paenibacillus illinoisensis TaxID=59845 RepID=A0A2W0CCL1_9BACL|nr:hypothetical protein PIL02S_05460 [Paenibacillus illinoisensis]
MSGPFLVFRSIYPGVMGNNDQPLALVLLIFFKNDDFILE